MEERLLTFFFLFFCRFRTWRLGIDAQDSWKGNCEGGEAVCFVFIMEERLLTFFFLFFCRFQTWRLGIDAQDSWKGNCEGGGAVCFVFIMEERLLMFFFFFFVDFGLGDLELTPRKVIVKVVKLCVVSLICKNV
jgi:hypothetical protein